MTQVIGTIASSWRASTAFDSIATATGTGSSGTITFSSIPQTYAHLQIRAIARSTEASTGFTYLRIQLNGVTTTSYSTHNLNGDGTTVSATGYASQSLIEIGNVVRANEAPSNYGVSIIDIFDYASTAKATTVYSATGWNANGSGRIMELSGLFTSTAAISSITLQLGALNFTSASQFALYGIKGA